jgi:DNA helicase-4
LENKRISKTYLLNDKSLISSNWGGNYLSSNENIQSLIDLITYQEKLKKKRIIGYILLPVVAGFFYLKSLNKKINETKERIYAIQKEIINEIQQNINTITDKYNKTVEDDTYLIYSVKSEQISHSNNYLSQLQLLQQYKEYFNPELQTYLQDSIRYVESMRKKFSSFNEEFVERRKEENNDLFKKVPFGLDDFQKSAIIKDDKHNLIVAGAGAGKTEVLTTRIAYLIERKDKIKPERILALAFQRDARKEMETRLKKRFGFNVEIKTFHALGKKILKKAGKPSEINGGDNHEKKFRDTIYELYKKAEEETGFKNEIINFLKMRGSEEIKVKTKFTTKKEKEEYYEYMRNLRYRTLDDYDVKSLAERDIMNFYFTHKLNGEDIKVLYEEIAPWTKIIGDKDTVSYPDFYIEKYDIWHEHWTVDDKDENSKVPEWYEQTTEDYKTNMHIKRSRFKELKIPLIETYDFEHNNDDFIKILKQSIIEKLNEKYPDEKFEFTPIEHDELVEKVWKECKKSIESIPENIGRFIINAKTYGFTPDKLERRLQEEKWSPVQNIFGRIATKIYRQYQELMNKEEKIDFEDMINNCIEVLNENHDLYYDLFDHILIDEYQDISKQRHILIETLMKKNPNAKLFAVGDDWQSIMSFAGSDLQYFVNFNKYFPHPEITKLPMNYRSIKSIVDIGTEIIKNNSGLKIDKETLAHNDEIKPVNIYLSRHEPIKKYIGRYYDQITDHCMNEINNLIEQNYDPSKDILLLTRFKKNQFLNERLESFIDMNRIPLKTAHSSKGMQSRAVFILDVTKGQYGFPCELENPKLLEPAKEEKIDSKLEEERRLFYVAVTRAKENLFIYSQLKNESKFINEIIPYEDIVEIEKLDY